MLLNKLDSLIEVAQGIVSECRDKYGRRSPEFLCAQNIWYEARLLRVQIVNKKDETEIAELDR